MAFGQAGTSDGIAKLAERGCEVVDAGNQLTNPLNPSAAKSAALQARAAAHTRR